MNINRFSTRVTACSHGKRQGATSGNMLFMGLATGAYKEHIGILPRDVPCYFPCEQALTVVELIFTYSGSFDGCQFSPWYTLAYFKPLQLKRDCTNL